MDEWENVEPYITKCERFYNNNPPQQEEEFADGMGFWKVEPAAAQKDMNSGQFFVTLWRTDQVADDDNNATADFKVYCGFTAKLSVFNLPYKHPLVNPVAVARAKHAEITYKLIVHTEEDDRKFDRMHHNVGKCGTILNIGSAATRLEGTSRRQAKSV